MYIYIYLNLNNKINLIITIYDLWPLWFLLRVQVASLNVAAWARRLDSETVISSNVVHSYWCWFGSFNSMPKGSSLCWSFGTCLFRCRYCTAASHAATCRRNLPNHPCISTDASPPRFEKTVRQPAVPWFGSCEVHCDRKKKRDREEFRSHLKQLTQLTQLTDFVICDCDRVNCVDLYKRMHAQWICYMARPAKDKVTVDRDHTVQVRAVVTVGSNPESPSLDIRWHKHSDHSYAQL